MDQRQNHKGNEKKYFKINKNEKTAYQNLWDAVKAVLSGKFIVADEHIEKDLK